MTMRTPRPQRLQPVDDLLVLRGIGGDVEVVVEALVGAEGEHDDVGRDAAQIVGEIVGRQLLQHLHRRAGEAQAEVGDAVAFATDSTPVTVTGASVSARTAMSRKPVRARARRAQTSSVARWSARAVEIDRRRSAVPSTSTSARPPPGSLRNATSTPS